MGFQPLAECRQRLSRRHLPGNSPGAAAPGYLVASLEVHRNETFRAAIGLVITRVILEYDRVKN